MTPATFRRLMIPFGLLFLLPGLVQAQEAARYLPHEDLGSLFEAVQLGGVFADSKTFVDAVPLQPPPVVVERYLAARDSAGFDLGAFVERHFDVPEPRSIVFQSEDADLRAHLTNLWPYLTRDPDTTARFSSLLPLPHPYVVPGGRFREIYYWDSYFTMLGLVVSDRMDLVRHMADNFATLIRREGFIPNGNRTYYLTRSQPPFFALIVDLIAQQEGDAAALAYLDDLRAEYDFWMAGLSQVQRAGQEAEHVARLGFGLTLNRYWDRGAAPRPESYREDYELAQDLPPAERPLLWKDLRSGAESGWDYSSRWFDDNERLATIRTTEIAPVDLNALLYFAEQTLARLYRRQGDVAEADAFKVRARRRQAAIQRYHWDDERGFYYDYDHERGRRTDAVTLAAAYPLFFGIATPEQARRVAERLEADLLRPGGFVTTTRATGEQWDAPNGWAPLQWITIQGLRRYGFDRLADEAAGRWLRLNREVYQRTGRMMEKYNVVDLSLEAGGGEYALQDGFGWTNGVALALLAGLPGPR